MTQDGPSRLARTPEIALSGRTTGSVPAEDLICGSGTCGCDLRPDYCKIATVQEIVYLIRGLMSEAVPIAEPAKCREFAGYWTPDAT